MFLVRFEEFEKSSHVSNLTSTISLQSHVVRCCCTCSPRLFSTPFLPDNAPSTDATGKPHRLNCSWWCNFISIISQHKRAIQLSDSFCTDCKKNNGYNYKVRRIHGHLLCHLHQAKQSCLHSASKKLLAKRLQWDNWIVNSKCQDFESSYDIRDTLNYDMFNHSKTYVASFLASHCSNKSNQPKPLQPTQTNRSAMAPRPAPKCKVFGGLCA